MAKKPLILVTNDDGVVAPGIRALVEAMQTIGEVVVVAPDSPQSGMGHAVTLNHPIRINEVDIFDGVKAYQCSGTPADCVKIAIDVILHKKPDICVSGINHGSNSSINVIYSGTMSAAMEAAIDGINSVGFSLLNGSLEADMQHAGKVAKKVVEQIVQHGIPKGALLNVNIPDIPFEALNGFKICRQADAKWIEEFDERKDPRGNQYYWLTGRFVNFDDSEDTDEWALKNNYVSVVPVQYDLTNYKAMDYLNQHWKLDASA